MASVDSFDDAKFGRFSYSKVEIEPFKYRGTNVDIITEKYKEKIFAGLINGGFFMAKKFEDMFHRRYHFERDGVLDDFMSLQFNTQQQTATFTVMNTNLSMNRVVHYPPPSMKEPGYTLFDFREGGMSRAKGFPISFTSGGGILASRSGIKERRRRFPTWEKAQSKIPIASGTYIERTVNSLQVDFEALAKKTGKMRPHTFISMRTENLAEFALRNLETLLYKVPEGIVHELRAPKKSMFSQRKHKLGHSVAMSGRIRKPAS